jgi:HSF-type DNA-binding
MALGRHFAAPIIAVRFNVEIIMPAVPQHVARPLPLRKAALAAITKIFEDSRESVDDVPKQSRAKPIAKRKKTVPKKKAVSPSKWPRRLHIQTFSPLGPNAASPTREPSLKRQQSLTLHFPKVPGADSSRALLNESENPPGILHEGRRHLNRVTFPLKLFNLLETGLYPNAIRWDKCGTSFRIEERKALERILPNAGFDHSKIRSFHRQLSLWGFSRSKGGIVDPNKDARNKKWQPEVWAHPYFIQGMHRDCLFHVVRVGRKKGKENKNKNDLRPTPVTPERSFIHPVMDGPEALASAKATTTSDIMRSKSFKAKTTKTINKRSSNKAMMATCPKDMIPDDRCLPLLPSFDCGGSILLPKRISFHECGFEQAYDPTPLPLDHSDSCFSAISFNSDGDVDWLHVLPIQETAEDHGFTDAEFDWIEQV